MSYLIWRFLGGRNRYPTGLSWFLLSLVRVLDWAAFIGIGLLLTVQVMGFAVDARSYMHYKALQGSYDIDIKNMRTIYASNSEDHEKQYDINFENFRRTEKQRAIFGNYGRLLVLQEQVFDQWRTLFNYDGIVGERISLIPFFWLNGKDTTSHSMSELEGSYTVLGMEMWLKNANTSQSDYYQMINLYDPVNVGYMKNALTEKNGTKQQWDRYYACQEVAAPYRMTERLKSMPLQRADSKTFIDTQKYYNESKALFNDSAACFTELQDEIGVKRYPTQEMMDYNQMVFDYKDAALAGAIQRAQQDELENGASSRGVPLYNTYDLDWETRLYKKYLLHCESEVDCAGEEIPDSWDKGYGAGSIKPTPFYDVIVDKNKTYKD